MRHGQGQENTNLVLELVILNLDLINDPRLLYINKFLYNLINRETRFLSVAKDTEYQNLFFLMKSISKAEMTIRIIDIQNFEDLTDFLFKKIILSNSRLESLSMKINAKLSNEPFGILKNLPLESLEIKRPETSQYIYNQRSANHKNLMEYLGDIKTLQQLSLESIYNLAGSNIKGIERLYNLTQLSFYNIDIDDVAMQYVFQLSSLEILKIEECHSIEARDVMEITKLQNLEILEIRDCTEFSSNIIAPLSELKSLRSLRLNNGKFEIDDLALLNNPNLIILNISDFSDRRFRTKEQLESLGKLTNLTSLDMQGNRFVSDPELFSFLPKLQKLKLLSLYGCTGRSIFDNGDEVVIEGDGNMGIQIGHLKYITRLADSLEALNLGYNKYISGSEIAELGVLTNLRYLNLSKCHYIEDADLAVLKNFPKMKYLELAELTRITDLSITYLQDMKDLERLDIEMCKKITMETLTFPLNKLEKLDCSMSVITDQGIENIVEHCTRVEKLYLASCYQFTYVGLDNLKNLPNLQKLNIQLSFVASKDSDDRYIPELQGVEIII